MKFTSSFKVNPTYFLRWYRVYKDLNNHISETFAALHSNILKRFSEGYLVATECLEILWLSSWFNVMKIILYTVRSATSCHFVCLWSCKWLCFSDLNLFTLMTGKWIDLILSAKSVILSVKKIPFYWLKSIYFIS